MTSGEKVYDFGVGIPSKPLQIAQSVICKTFSVWGDPSTEDEYHEAADYGLNEGSLSARSNLADWINASFYAQFDRAKNTSLIRSFATRLALPLIESNKEDIAREENTTSDSLLESKLKVFGKKIVSICGKDLILTCGASHGMGLLINTLMKLNKSRIILIEDPSYFLFANIVNSYHGKLVPIKTSFRDGIDLDYLEKVLKYFSKINIKIACLFCVPSHHNPLGIQYTISKRENLIKLAHKYKLNIISDEVYNLLSFCEYGDKNSNAYDSKNNSNYNSKQQHREPAMIPYLSQIEQALFENDVKTKQEKKDNHDEENNSGSNCNFNYLVSSISSFSKIMGPGFRLGWIHACNDGLNKAIIDHGVLTSGGSLNQFSFSILAKLLIIQDDIDTSKIQSNLYNTNIVKNDLFKHLMFVKCCLTRKSDILCKAIHEQIAKNENNIELNNCKKENKLNNFKLIEFIEPQGGYFLFLKINLRLKDNKKDSLILDNKGNVIETMIDLLIAEWNKQEDDGKEEKEKEKEKIKIIFKRGLDMSSCFGPVSKTIEYKFVYFEKYKKLKEKVVNDYQNDIITNEYKNEQLTLIDNALNNEIKISKQFGLNNEQYKQEKEKEFAHYLRLCFAYLNFRDMDIGARILVDSIYKMYHKYHKILNVTTCN